MSAVYEVCLCARVVSLRVIVLGSTYASSICASIHATHIVVVGQSADVGSEKRVIRPNTCGCSIDEIDHKNVDSNALLRVRGVNDANRRIRADALKQSECRVCLVG